jgi:uracil phosphoribosyltransferase
LHYIGAFLNSRNNLKKLVLEVILISQLYILFLPTFVVHSGKSDFMVHVLSEKNSIVNQYMYELRHKEIQQDRLRFRLNIERLGELMAYEISKTLLYAPKTVETPLGEAIVSLPVDSVVVGSVLRAGIPFHQGILRVFDHAGNAFFSAYRKHHKNGSFEIKMGYATCPELEDTVLILADPMLATGASVAKVLNFLASEGTPKKIHLATIISSRYGIDFVHREYPDVEIWTAAVDEELTAKSYIVPGLGDAGDLMFGPKLQD